MTRRPSVPLRLDLLADDGAVVYLNGVEVVRDNVAPGPVDERHTRRRVPVDAGRRDHVDPLDDPRRSSCSRARTCLPSASTTVPAAATCPSTPSSPPATASAPTPRRRARRRVLVVTDATSDSLRISWDVATDNVGVAEYRLQRDGVADRDASRPHLPRCRSRTGDHLHLHGRRRRRCGQRQPHERCRPRASPPAPSATRSPSTSSGDTSTPASTPARAGAAPGFDDSAWPAGQAELGAGDGDEATIVTNRPVVWFRTAFAVDDPAALARATLALRADDGAVVYVNGVEVVRDNVGPGPVTATTPALGYRWTTADESALRTFDLPVSALVAGTNVVAVSVHNGPGSSDLSFAATLETEGVAAPDTTPPTVPGTPIMSWPSMRPPHRWPGHLRSTTSRSTATRSGATAPRSARPSPLRSSTPDSTPATTYTYRVRAVDAAGQRRAAVAAGDGHNGTRRGRSHDADRPETPTGGTSTPGVAPAVRIGPARASTTAPGWWAPPSWAPATATRPPSSPTVRSCGSVTPSTSPTQRRSHRSSSRYRPMTVPSCISTASRCCATTSAPGPLDATTPALDYRWGPAETELRTFALDPASLTAGSNVIAVSIHNGPGSTDSSFSASLALPDPAGSPAAKRTSVRARLGPTLGCHGLDRRRPAARSVLAAQCSMT